jgi:acyl transferase domain-containing protein/NAD(P)H-dependent flavin oxidoreductase YrpB (nitropropane dioxygenase family)/NADP-dependent 3-hydroxy acid dehydrogenase YdfG
LKKIEICVATPFEAVDVALSLSAAEAGAFPLLHLGRDREAAVHALESLSQRLTEPFGVCCVDKTMATIPLPKQVTRVILPWGDELATLAALAKTSVDMHWQVRSVAEAKAALATRPKALILKGSEGAGFCGVESSFVLFQSLMALCREADVDVYIQGGVGVHSSAAYLTLGARGVVLDSQVALFPECSAPANLKASIARLNGSEIRSCEGYHYLLRPGAPDPGENATFSELLPRLGTTDEHDCLPLGQDAILAADYAENHKRLKYLVKAIRQASFSQVRLAQTREVLAPGDDMSTLLGTRYPLAQGPMARISDVPEFLRDVADGGALPFLAMSMMVGAAAEKALANTAAAMEDKPWGVGILGFAYPKMLEEQTRLILEAKPPVVLIAGGRPSLAKPFEQAGSKVFLHVPAAGLLEMFLKEGSRSFIFEGRESGGHVGPLFSTVLWEKQMYRLLKQDDPSSLNIFFAGGIHDTFSAAFVRILAAPLVARDVKVGIIAGTAYLFTDEIVERGAITEDYRKLLIEGDHTLLLKSGGGQETRSIPSPFTDFFQSERRRMLDEGEDPTQILMRLEDLNIGRLRIASKGIERRGDELVVLSAEEQQAKGLFMTGAVTPLIRQTTTIPQLHECLIEESRRLLDTIPLPENTSPMPKSSAVPDAVPVAVIGMAGVFPDAANIDEYWRNILFGKDSITEVPSERWSAELFYDPEGKDTDHVVSKWGGFIGTVDFDALEFGITPQSLAAIEPVQLLSLLVTKRALEDAGYSDLSRLDLDDTAVIFGAQGAGDLTSSYGYRTGLRQLFGGLTEEMDDTLPRLTEDSFPGMLSNVIAGRVSNRLNTGGRNFTVDAACASSLAALDIALSELVSNRANMVVLGGADAHNSINDFLMFSSTFALSKRGRCAAFDAEADGITLGEGVGVLILKRLEDAQRDGNKIYAVIRSAGSSSDGKSLGLTAPSKRGQVRALEQAYASAGVHPSQVGLIEAHGTGTAVGDHIELSALTDVFLDAGTLPKRTQLGSVKTQIGHTKCAAGAAGLIKAVLSVQHGLRPATLNLKNPNNAYANNGPFFFRTESTGFWSEKRRIAGVSGFGFGGTNFHALVENVAPEYPPVSLKAWPSELFIFHGKTPDEGKALMEKIKTLYAVNSRFELRDIAYSLSCYNREEAIQYAIVASSADELLARIDEALDGQTGDGVYPLNPVDGKVAFLFSGQGSQRVNMAADLFVLFPWMRRLLEAHPDYEHILFPPAAFTVAEKKAQQAAITDTRNAQPLLGLVDLAIAELLRDFGVKADMVAGHSYGELPALCFAGAFEADALLGLSRARAEITLAAAGADPGRMAAINMDRATLDELLKDETEIWAVNFNAPQQTVVAGASKALESFLNKLAQAKINFTELNVACAFHSPLLVGAESGFAQVLADARLHKTTLPVWSNTTAALYPKTPAAIKKRLAEHLVKPVRFVEEVEQMYADGARVFIETGPGAVLTGLAGRILEERQSVLIQTERKGEEGLTWLLRGLARYISTGREVDFERLFEGRDATTINIDEPERYRKRGTVWNVNGQRALPENGELPTHAGKLNGGLSFGLSNLNGGSSTISSEQLIMAYFNNMNDMIQDQRDILFSYLGQTEVMPRATLTTRQPIAASAAALPQAPTAVDVVGQETGDAKTGQAGSAPPDILKLSAEEVMTLILAVVSEKTGYPIDMIDFDANLEADLSIDSIKKMEIVGGLRERATFPDEGGDIEESFEKLISIKTLKEMLDWILGLEAGESTSSADERDAEDFAGVQAVESARSLSGFDAEGGANDGAENVENTADTEGVEGAGTVGANDGGDIIINRMILGEKPAPAQNPDVDSLKNARFAITEDGAGLAAAVANALRRRGATATVIAADAIGLAGYDGLVFINAAASGKHHTISELFALMKQADMDKLRWIFTFDDSLAALLETGDLSELGLLEGFPGFIKSLKHEYPEKRLAAVSFHTLINPQTFPELVVSELSDAEPFPEIIYRNSERLCLLPDIKARDTTDTAWSDAEPIGPKLDQNSRILVLGGAQGITPALVSRLALVYPCHYLLVGRSTVAPANEAYKNLTSVDEIRGYLIKHEGMKQPREVEKKAKEIFKGNQIRDAIACIEAAGAKATYYSADVRDAEAFGMLVDEIRESCGPIDGVIHAAGILEDKLFRNKELDSFERVYGTKVDPLQVIVKKLLPDLKLLVMFSSVSSTFGNAGQCDYAAGNSVMDSVAHVLARHRPELRVVAFNWGPWKGAGMVNEGLEQEFRKRGVAFLQLDEGSAFFVDEVTHGSEHGVVALAGNHKGLESLFAAIPQSARKHQMGRTYDR